MSRVCPAADSASKTLRKHTAPEDLWSYQTYYQYICCKW